MSIRTTRDRCIAFPPLKNGSSWRTLDDCDVVAVASVDSKENPTKIEVYFLPADDVRKRFDESYAARRKAGRVVRDRFGMWLALDPRDRGLPSDIGTGLAKAYQPIAVYSIADLIGNADQDEIDLSEYADDDEEVMREGAPHTIAEVMAWARERIAEIAGVAPTAVKLDLTLKT